MDNRTVFFDGYNNAVETAHDKYFNISEEEAMQDNGEEEGLLERFLADEISNWENTCLAELGGVTPAQFIVSVDDFAEIMEFFRAGASICHDSLPEIFIRKLQTFGEAAVEALVELSGKTIDGEYDDEVFSASLMSIEILGLWKVEKAVKPLIELLYSKQKDFEMISECVKDALINIGEPAIPLLVQNIETRGFECEAGEYLLMALADIGYDNKSDEIYKCLKNAFTVMPSKAIGAICLGNYGDGRAIPALRGFLEKNKGRLDRIVFYEVVSAIESLGGNAEDLSISDFTGDRK